MDAYETLVSEFKNIRREKGMTAQDIAGNLNCQPYSFEKRKRDIRLTTLLQWLSKMDCHLEIIKNKK